MSQEQQAGFFRPVEENIDTPRLEVDRARLTRNLTRVQQIADAAGVRLRPHVKTHKSVAIALVQQQLGAQGITVAKPQEGITFIVGGIRDVLLAYPVVRSASLLPLLATAVQHQATVSLIAASHQGVEAIAEAAQATGYSPDVWIKVDVGLHRVGVDPQSDEALALQQAISGHQLRFAGILSHAGQAYGAGDRQGIARVAEQEARLMQHLQQRFADAGIRCPISTGSTPTALGAPVAPGYVEIRPGNYALLDLTALRLGLCDAGDLAMTVVARVVAVNDRYAIIDAGSKALSSDRGPHGTNASGFGLAASQQTGRLYEVEKLSEEHGFVPHLGQPPAIGSLLRVYPNHACAVMAQFNSGTFCDENGRPLQPTLTIDARGQFL